MNSSTQEPKVSNPPPLESTQTMPEELLFERFDAIMVNTTRRQKYEWLSEEITLAKSQERATFAKKLEEALTCPAGHLCDGDQCCDSYTLQLDNCQKLLESLQKEGEHE